MNPNEKMDLDNPGLSPADRMVLQQLQTPTHSSGDAEKVLLEIPLDALATRFLRDAKHTTFATIEDADLNRWLQAEWSREPDDEAHAKKYQRLYELWRAAVNIWIALQVERNPMPPEMVALLGTPASLAEATRRYREVASR